MQYYDQENGPANVAYYAIKSVCYAVIQATKQALECYPDLPVVFSGGVSSNSLLRESCAFMNPVFAQPQYSTDNAMGIAVLASLQE